MTTGIKSPLRLVSDAEAFAITQSWTDAPYARITLWRTDDRIDVHDKRIVLADVNSFGCVEDLLDEIYRAYLSCDVKPGMYGADWLLVSGPVLVPLEWATNPGAPIHQVNPAWARGTTLADARMLPGSRWGLITHGAAHQFAGHGVHVIHFDTEEFFEALAAYPQVTEHLLMNEKLFSRLTMRKAPAEGRKYGMVQPRLAYTDSAGTAFCETRESASDRTLLAEEWKNAMRIE